ncbi:hypothetical protein [Nostocoides sp. HKS02]|uniref:PGAP1-like alpha/beta domain-containing protein n=1 Tax=Nostocoides sp. HKS02 TaxID=1813880 RepID=UPI0012B4AAF4|nr:hypothetical protein [Tetrasphaera sp. HKS02]QGN58310.1 hypothetical protein GKE56_10915 [Tetrasphaera sp. HKS02]
MRASGIDVEGGVGGTAVGLDSLDAAARQLTLVTSELGDVLARTLAVAADAELQVSAALSPVTAAQAELAVAWASGPAGLAGQLAATTALATATTSATAAYRASEAVVSEVVDDARDQVMFLVGASAPGLVVGLLTLEATGVDLGAALNSAVFEVPELADLAGGVSGLTAGLAVNPVTGPIVRADEPRHAATYDPYADSLAVLADSAAGFGLLSDAGQPRVLAEPSPRRGARAPDSLAALVRDQANLSDTDHYPGHVRVVEVPQRHGSAWIVEISGTQAWDPHAGANPHDVTTDVRLMARESTVLADAVERALSRAQAASGRDTTSDPVMLAGHSLGGIVSAGLASSPEFTRRHRVTHVVTLGSPIARMPVPRDVEVLSLEHTQDPVPRLEGHRNPDRRSWVTVTRDLRDDADVVRTGVGAHDTAEYTQTAEAVDASTDPSVEQWRQGSRHFFQCRPGASPVVRDFRLERVVPRP